MSHEQYGDKSVDDVREKVMDLLATYYARGALEIEEYENRVAIAARTQTRGELEALVGNLPALAPMASRGPERAAPTDPASPGATVAPAGEVRENQTLAAVFSSVSRRGEWRPARQTQAISFFGSTDLDLRQAILPPGVSILTVFAFFGSVSVLVPPGVNVEMNGVGVFGSFDSNVPEDRRAGVPTIRVDGIVVFGSASVRIKRPKNS